MPAHNIIDNHRRKLVDHITRSLETSNAGGVVTLQGHDSGLPIDAMSVQSMQSGKTGCYVVRLIEESHDIKAVWPNGDET